MTHDEAIGTALSDRMRRARGRLSRNCVASAKVTRTEQDELESAAQRQGKALSEWAREVLLREARNAEADPLFSEVIALRMMLANLLKPVCCGQSITPEAFDAQLQNVRNTKQQMAQEVRQQYAAVAAKEQ